MALNPTSFRNEFRYPQDLIFLNSGSMSLSPICVLDRVQKEKEIYESNPTDGLFGAWGRMWDTQKNLAQFFKADPRTLFLRSNVTYVMNDMLMALELPKGSEILISDVEYGALVRICQYKAELEGHSVRSMSFHDKGQDPRTINEDQLLQRLEDSLRPETKLVMLSHVMTGSGLTLPIEKMARLLRSKNIFFAVDGAHGAGAKDLNFTQTEVDLYGSNLHKWLMGPKGTGFGFVAPRMRDHLRPKFAGWTTMGIDPHFALFGEGDPWTARWMICSTHNFSDFYGINAALEFWRTAGPEKIWAEQRRISEYAATTVSETTGWPCLSQYPTADLRSPLVAFQLPEKIRSRGFELIFHLQKEKRMVISMTTIQGDWCLRVSPNIYNTTDEIDRAAEILADLPQ